MRRPSIVFALAVLAPLVTAALAGDEREASVADGASLLCYRAESWDGKAAPSADSVKSAAAMVAKRCIHEGLAGSTAAVTASDTVEIRLPKAHADSEAVARGLAERRGLVEFRIRAEQSVEDEYRDRKIEGGTRLPIGFGWAQDETNAAKEYLVEIPEAAAQAALDAASSTGDAPSAELRTKLEKNMTDARSASVFTNADMASATVRRSMSTYGAQFLRHVAVRFEFVEGRKAAFEKFTGDHVGRTLCVIVDGKVHVCPVINAAIPGAGELRAPGTGYTEERAQAMAAVLEGGPLPCRLVPLRDK